MASRVLCLAVSFVVYVCMAYAICKDCNDLTEVCDIGNSTQTCPCRPSLFRESENGPCRATKSYTTTVDFGDWFEWNEQLNNEGSEEYINLSNQICNEFNDTIATDQNIGSYYYGCEVVAFSVSDDGTNHGIVVLSLFDTNQEDTDASGLNDILIDELSPSTYDNESITTTATDECEFGLDDCHVLATCVDTGAVGFKCMCSDDTDDVSLEGLPGRECEIRSLLYIVGITTGASLVLFFVMVFIVVCVSAQTTIGKPPSQIERERHDIIQNKSRDTDETPLDPRGEGGGVAEGVTNDGFENAQVPESIFDVNDDQMARLAQIHLAIERNSSPATFGVPPAHRDNQIEMSRMPSVDYGLERLNVAPFQNDVRQQPRNEQRPRRLAYGDEMNESVSASRLPISKYDQRHSTSPPATPGVEPYMSRQSSSVFLPSSPRTSRDYGAGGGENRYDYKIY